MKRLIAAILSLFMSMPSTMTAVKDPTPNGADVERPYVVSSNLSIDAQAGYTANVDINIKPTITFSEDMSNDPYSGITSTYAVYLYEVGGTGSVAITKAYDSNTKTLTITPNAPLKNGKAYKVFLGSYYCKDLSGNGLVENIYNGYQMYFSTAGAAGDIIPPVALSSTPINGAVSVPVDFTGTVTFNENMDPSTINSTNILLEKKINSYTFNAVGANVSYDAASRKVTVKSSSPLEAFTDYRINIKSNAVKDSAGNVFDGKTVEFKTVSTDLQPPVVVSTNIADGAVDVLPQTKMQVTFNEALKFDTFSNFVEVKKNGAVVNISSWGIGTDSSTANKVLYIPGKYSNVVWDKSATYEITVKPGLSDVYENKTTETYKYSFTTVQADTVPPVLKSLTPANEEANVSLNPVITAIFNEALDTTTFNDEYDNPGIYYSNDGSYWQKFKDSQYKPAYTFAYDESDKSNTKLTITPTLPLKANTRYRIDLSVCDLQGNFPTNRYYYFTTGTGNTSGDTIAPTIVSSYPEKRDYLSRPTNIPTNMEATVIFSESMKSSSINSTNMYISYMNSSYQSVPVLATISYDEANKKATVKPVAALDQNREYTLVVKNVEDLAGNKLVQTYEAYFKTAIEDTAGPIMVSTSPANGEKNVEITREIKVTFNENLQSDQNSVLNNIIVKENGSVIPKSTAYNDKGIIISAIGKELTIKKSVNGSNIWTKGCTYEVTLKGGIADEYGNPMGSDKVFSFSTIENDTTPPVIKSLTPNLSTDKANPTVNIDLKPTFNAIFNEPLEAASYGQYGYAGIYYFIGDTEYRLKDSGNDAFTVVCDESDPSNVKLTVSSKINLQEGKLYMLQLEVRDKQYNPTQGNKFYFMVGTQSGDPTPPTVVLSYPEKRDYLNRMTDVPTDMKGTLTFSEPMNLLSITAENVFIGYYDVVQNKTIKVPALVSYDSLSRVATVDPISDLEQNKEYYLAAENVTDLSGNKIAGGWVAEFRTAISDKTGPSIVSVYPSENAVGAPIDKRFKVTFDEPIKSDGTLINANIVVRANGVVIPPSQAMADNGITAVVDGNNIYISRVYKQDGQYIWAKGTNYEITIMNGLTDVFGNKMTSGKTWSFSTIEEDKVAPTIVTMSPDLRSSTEAAPSNVSGLRTPIKVKFSEAMADYRFAPINMAVGIKYSITDSQGTLWQFLKDPNGNNGFTVAYDSVNFEATITPTIDLKEGAKYQLYMSVFDLQGNSLDRDTYYFVPKNDDPNADPKIVSVDPASYAFGVQAGVQPKITFNVSMDETTFSGNVKLKKGATYSSTVIDADMSYNDSTKVLTIIPKAPLEQYTDYSITLDVSKVKSKAGKVIGGYYPGVTFKTTNGDAVSPSIIGTTPSEGAINVDLKTNIQIQFSEVVQSHPDITNKPLKNYVRLYENNILTDRVPSIDSSNKSIIRFDAPYAGWKDGAVYKVEILSGDGILDMNGNPITVGKSFSFTCVNNTITPLTVIQTTPASDATNVPLSQIITAKFSIADVVASDGSSNLKNNVVLMEGSSVRAWESLDLVNIPIYGDTLTIKLNSPLHANTKYTVIVKAGVKTYDGKNTMASDFSWSFNTGAGANTTAPKVISRKPSKNAEGAGLNTTVEVQFDMDMDTTKINNTTVKIQKYVQDPTAQLLETIVPVTVSYNSATKSVIAAPNTALLPNTKYVVNIGELTGSNGIKYEGDNGASCTWTFTTGDSSSATNPAVEIVKAVSGTTVVELANNVQGIRTDSSFEILFNKLMDEKSIKNGSSEAIYITPNADLSLDIFTLTFTTITTENGKTKATLKSYWPLDKYTKYYLVIPATVKDAEGKSISRNVIGFTTEGQETELNTVVKVDVDKVVINSGVSKISPVEVNKLPQTITVMTSRELADMSINDGAIRIWEENGTAYGKLVTGVTAKVEGNCYIMDVSKATLSEDKVYRVQINHDYLLAIDEAELDKDYIFYFKPVNKDISYTKGQVSVKGNNILKKDETSVLTVTTDIMKLKTMSFTLNYDTTLLSAEKVELVDSLKNTGITVTIEKDNSGAETGRIKFNAALENEINAVDLFKVTFKSLKGERATLTFGDIPYTKGDDVPSFAKGKSFIITGTTLDLNMDGKVTVLDVIMVSRAIGINSSSAEWETYKGRDINDDKVINEADADIIKTHLGEVIK